MVNKTKIVLITGGSRGLGKDMALEIAKKGLDVIITYHSKKDEALAVVKELETSDRKAIALQLDTSDLKSFDSFFGKIKEVLKEEFNADHIDYLVNNAGTGLHALFAETTEEQFDSMLNIHFKGVFFLRKKHCHF